MNISMSRVVAIVIFFVGCCGLVFVMGGDDFVEDLLRPRLDVYDSSGCLGGGYRRETDEEYTSRIEEEDRDFDERYALKEAKEDACRKAKEKACREAFQKRIEKFRASFKKGKDTSALHRALRKADFVAVVRSIKRARDPRKLVNNWGESGLCPLNIAVWTGSAAAIAFLLENEANLFMGDRDGNNALHTAVIANKPGILAVLLTAAKNEFVNISGLLSRENSDGYTPLTLAKALKATECEELLNKELSWWERLF